MGKDLRINLNLLKVAGLLYHEPDAQHYGLSISKRTGLGNGALYPILDKLEDGELITATWEEIDERAAGRRARRFYHLTAKGISLFESELQKLSPLTER